MKNPIQSNKLVINGIANIIAASAVEYKEKWQVDNDIILRKTYYTPACSSVELDSINCSGILEKNINPYVKGLIGNFKPYRSYIYYGSRADSNVNVATAIRKNGYLNNFSNFWGFNASNNLVPDYTNPKWVWNSELTKVNSKGQELETKDALNRYTSAQYGFNKNMPVAMVQNARYGEAFNEAFEDYSYMEAINKVRQDNCNSRYINFTGGGSIINTDTSATLRAHSGKYILRVNGNSQVSKGIEVKQPGNEIYNFNFGKDTSKVLNDLGGNFSFESQGGAYWSPATANFPTSTINVDVYPSAVSFHRYIISCNTYIKITTQGTYNFQLSLSTNYNNTSPGPQSYSNGMGVSIYDQNNNLINYTPIFKNITPGSSSSPYSLILCPGIYKIVGDISETYQQSTNPSDSHNFYTWACSNCQSPDYKTLSTQNGCISTKPIPATDSMLNPVFKLVPGKRMQFSTWVKEDCDSIVCYKPAYLMNHVELQFPGSGSPNAILRPSGTIIEGWQKIEGEFTVPANATSANLVLSNDGSQKVYFDDIRIHPFNANMKSYVYDPRTLRLSAELDENNYASFYEYDEEGQLVRVKKETIEGIKTIKETRSAKQKSINDVQ